LGVGLALVGGLLTVAARWGGSRVPAPTAPAAFEVSRAVRIEPAPAFRLVDLQGRAHRLGDLRGRVVLLNFWATWCEPCREEMPAIQTLARELEGQGLAVLAVNYQEAPAAVTAFVGEYRLTLPVLLDPTGDVGGAYHVFALPASFFVDRRGALLGAALGYREWGSRAARRYLTELLAARS